MKTTGITRRMDELGRVVIPKEIRKNMHIKPGELLEISLNSPGEITLRKYSFINKDHGLINDLILSISNIINCDIVLINTSEVVFSTNDKYKGEAIIDDINDNADSMYLKINKSASIKQPFEVYKIMPNGDLEGYVIFDFKYSTTEKDKVLVDFLISFLNSYFEIN